MISPPRFFIADQALRSLSGHFFEYDVSVAANVPAPYVPLIIGNSDAEPEVLVRAAAFFQCDFWGPTGARVGEVPNGRSAANRLRRMAGLRSAGRNLAARLHLLLTLQRLRRRLASLRAVGRPAADLAAGRLNGADRVLKDIFLADLIALFSAYALQPQDVVFFPNMNHWTLAALAELPQTIPADRWPALKLLFRRNLDTLPTGAAPAPESAYWVGTLRRSFEQLSGPIAQGAVGLYTDTARLQAEYAVVAPVPMTVVPIPFRHDYIRSKARVPATFQVAYFGEARLEKGFGHLPALVDEFQAERASGRMRFVFQAVPAPEPAVLAAIERLRGQAGVELLDKPLTDQEYYALLNASDVVLLLYDPVSYFSRSSCIFVESVVSATPSITLANSWMASVMAPGTGEIVAGAGQIAAALRQILAGYAGYQDAIIRTSREWRQFHNPRRLVELLLESRLTPETLPDTGATL